MITNTRSEHRQLLRAVVSLQRQTRRTMAGAGAVPLHELDKLLADLADHFATEEASGGIYDRLAAKPELAGDVRRLRVDHQTLQTWGQLVRDRAAVPDAPQEAAEHVGAFLRALADHEAREEQLIQLAHQDLEGERP